MKTFSASLVKSGVLRCDYGSSPENDDPLLILWRWILAMFMFRLKLTVSFFSVSRMDSDSDLVLLPLRIDGVGTWKMTNPFQFSCLPIGHHNHTTSPTFESPFLFFSLSLRDRGFVSCYHQRVISLNFGYHMNSIDIVILGKVRVKDWSNWFEKVWLLYCLFIRMVKSPHLLWMTTSRMAQVVSSFLIIWNYSGR